MPLDSRIVIRPTTLEDAESINTLFNQVFECPRPLDVYTWKYGPQSWRPTRPSGMAAFLDGVAVGFYGCIPWQLSVAGSVVDVVQPCDVGVAVEHRASGVYEAVYDLFQRSQELFGRLAFGFPSSQSVTVGVARMGYKVQTGTVVVQRESGPLTIPPGLNVSETYQLPATWFPFITNTAAGLGITTHRSAEFCAWRFQAFPHRDWRFVSVSQQGELLGVAVYLTVHNGVRIYDLLAATDEAREALVWCIVDSNPGLPVMHGATVGMPYLDHLTALGFSPITNGSLVTALTTLDGVDTPDPQTDALRNSEDWACTFTDTDM